MSKSIFSPVLLVITAGFLLLTSCEKDTSLDKTPNKVNEWIYDIMKENYLWTEDLPSFKETDAEPEDFFNSLLSMKDGKHTDGKNHYYSTIEEDLSTRSGSSSVTYGFIPAYRYFENNPSTIYAAVKYVLPDSPAEKAGLKRGDWISHYNNIQLTDRNYMQFHAYTEKMTLTVGDLSNSGMVNAKKVEIEAAITMPENPILADTTLLVNNKKIGYLMYNSFVSGPTGNEDKAYDDQLKTVFTKFAEQNTEAFILDLRYNGGGLLSCAQLLATMLAPANTLGSSFCKLVYNESLNKKDTEYSLDKGLISSGGANLNLNRLYVITSRETASASELIINGLRPYMDVILIGNQTEGKNVGSQEFSGKSKNHPWILHPITCWVKNSQGFSDYALGFSPDFEVSDSFNSELGNPNEYMLSQALSVIETGNLIPTPTFRSTESKLRHLPQPQQGIRGIIID